MKKHLFIISFLVLSTCAGFSQNNVPVPDTPYIANQYSSVQNARFNITGPATIGGIGTPLSLWSSFGRQLSLYMSNNAETPASSWALTATLNGTQSFNSFSVVNTLSRNTGLYITGDGHVSINNAQHSEAALGVTGNTAVTGDIDVTGNIRAAGNVQLGMVYIPKDSSIKGHSIIILRAACPTGYRVISGGGGHRDYNGAVKDIHIGFSGPDEDSPNSTWRVMLYNSSGSSRAVRISCTCARVN